jgi:fused signal recognition particle receptor
MFLRTLFTKLKRVLSSSRALEASLWEELEEIFIESDMGVKVTQELIKELQEESRKRGVKDVSELYEVLRDLLIKLLKPYEAPFELEDGKKPIVVLLVGVNGVGKTTTLAKLAYKYVSRGKKVMVAAADTFRAAAIEQLEILAKRAGASLIKHQQGADPAAVTYDALSSAMAKGYDLLLIDTAGRLHTKEGLVEELKKIKRVLKKIDPVFPQETLLVLDATNGQNALIQAKTFHQEIVIDGIALAKLDGTAKGGILVAIAKELGLPIRFIGVGEGLGDLMDFSAEAFVKALLPSFNENRDEKES